MSSGIDPRLDPSDMAGAIAALPGQLRSVAARLEVAPPQLPDAARDATSVVLLGMGGSAIGGDIVRGAFSDRLPVPLITHRDPALPGFVGPRTLVVAASHSGRTEETLSSTRQAIERGAPIVAITTGGPLAQLAAEHGIPVVPYEAACQPRAAIGWGSGLLVAILSAAGLLDGIDAVAELRGAADAAERELRRLGPGTADEGNQAREIATAIAGRFPVVYGADHLAPIARRWKTQLNENAKTWALFDELPELAHNSVVGFAGPELAPAHTFVVLIHAADEDERATARREAITMLLAEAQIQHTTVRLEREPRFAQAVAGVVMGDLVSLYVALIRGVDPTPVPAIEQLKATLAR